MPFGSESQNPESLAVLGSLSSAGWAAWTGQPDAASTCRRDLFVNGDIRPRQAESPTQQLQPKVFSDAGTALTIIGHAGWCATSRPQGLSRLLLC